MADPVKIAVVMPSFDGTYRFDMINSLEAMMEFSASRGRVLHMFRAVGSNICVNRNNGIAFAKREGCDFCLQVDSDTVIFQPDYLERLLAHDVPVVSGMYYGKQFPFVPIAARWDAELGQYRTIVDFDQRCNELLEVDGVGGGFLLIRKDVFDVPPPAFCNFALDEGVTDKVIGEDYYFCRKAIANGFKVYLDTSVQLGHCGFYNFSLRDFVSAREAIRKQQLAQATEVNGHKEASRTVIVPAGNWTS